MITKPSTPWKVVWDVDPNNTGLLMVEYASEKEAQTMADALNAANPAFEAQVIKVASLGYGNHRVH